MKYVWSDKMRIKKGSLVYVRTNSCIIPFDTHALEDKKIYSLIMIINVLKNIPYKICININFTMLLISYQNLKIHARLVELQCCLRFIFLLKNVVRWSVTHHYMVCATYFRVFFITENVSDAKSKTRSIQRTHTHSCSWHNNRINIYKKKNNHKSNTYHKCG